MTVQINRNSFARETLTREVVHVDHRTGPNCSWCGGLSFGAARQGAPERLFRYFIETDGGRVHPISGLFCSVSCMRAYHS